MSSFQAKHVGCTEALDGDPLHRATVAEVNLRVALEESKHYDPLSIVLTTNAITLIGQSRSSGFHALLSLKDLVCITMHKRNGKRKLLALMVRAEDNPNTLTCHFLLCPSESSARALYERIKTMYSQAISKPVQKPLKSTPTSQRSGSEVTWADSWV